MNSPWPTIPVQMIFFWKILPLEGTVSQREGYQPNQGPPRVVVKRWVRGEKDQNYDLAQ